MPVTTLIELPAGAKVAQAIVGEPEQKYLVAGSGGYGFIATFEDMVSRVKAGKTFMTLDENEDAAAPGAAGRQASITSPRCRRRASCSCSRSTRCAKMPRGRGVIIMRLDDDDRMAAVALATAERVVLRGISRGKETVVAIEGDELAHHRLRRARKGYLLARRFKPEGFA